MVFECFDRFLQMAPVKDYLRPPFIPPFWLIVSILSMVGLDQIEGAARIVPADIGWVGWFLIGAAGSPSRSLRISSSRRRGTTILPFRESSALVTEGPFRLLAKPDLLRHDGGVDRPRAAYGYRSAVYRRAGLRADHRQVPSSRAEEAVLEADLRRRILAA